MYSEACGDELTHTYEDVPNLGGPDEAVLIEVDKPEGGLNLSVGELRALLRPRFARFRKDVHGVDLGHLALNFLGSRPTFGRKYIKWTKKTVLL